MESRGVIIMPLHWTSRQTPFSRETPGQQTPGISMSYCHFVSVLLRASHLRSLDEFPESFKNSRVFSLFFPAGEKKIDSVHAHGRVCRSSQRAFHIQSMADISRVCFPHGCDPSSKSNARIDLRRLNAGLQQSGALHYSHFSQGRKRKKDMCIMPG